MKNAGVVAEDAPSPRITHALPSSSPSSAQRCRDFCARSSTSSTHADLNGPPPPVRGRFYVFVDECHRTQGGDMNTQMKRWLEGAIFIGFTGTPLLRKDRQTTAARFRRHLHTHLQVPRGRGGQQVILDLKLRGARRAAGITSPQAIEAYFEKKTNALNNFQKAVVRKRWATMQELMSAVERKQIPRIPSTDSLEDFDLKPRLNNDRGTAIL